MQRTKKDDGKVLFIKTGGGSLRLASGKIIKPKERFRAYPDEIIPAFRDVVVPVEGNWDAVEEKEDVQAAAPPVFKLKRRGGSKYYDVVNEDGKVINEERLEKEAADDLLKSLN